jgi:thioredoxin
VETAPIEPEPVVPEPVVEAAPVEPDPIVKDGPIVKEPPPKPEPPRPSLVRKAPPIELEPDVAPAAIELEPVVVVKPAKSSKRVDPALGLARPVDATESTFEVEALHSDLPVVVDFWASWCAPCRAVSPILDQLAKEYAGKVKVIKVDADANPTLAAEYKVVSLPSIVVLKDGEVLSSIEGFRGREALEEVFVNLVK